MKNTRFTSLLCGGSLLISSCSNIQNDQTRTRTEGTLAGAGVGALAGLLTGRDTESTVKGAAIGSVGGFLYGDHVARKKENYRNTEDALDAAIARARQVNSELRSYNATLSSQITSLQRELAAARAAARRDEIARVQAKIRSNQNESKKVLARLDGEIRSSKKTLSGGGSSKKSSALRSEVSKLESTRSSLNSNVSRLAALSNQSDV